jgi:hypothetical protein
MGDIYTGYMGHGVLNGQNFRCTDFNVNVEQQFEFYNHIIGLNDTIPAGPDTKGEAVGTPQIQRTFVRPGVIGLQGSVSFPAAYFSTIAQEFFDYTANGDIFDLELYYHCEGGSGRQYEDSRVNSLSIDITAGDIVNFSVGVMAKSFQEIGTPSNFTAAQKLITWDEVTCSVAGINDDRIKAFSLEVSNNGQYIYTLDPNNGLSELAPHDLRLGMQEVSGTITVYNRSEGDNILPDCTNPTAPIEIELSWAGFAATLQVLLLPKQTNSSTSALTSTIAFVGVDKALGVGGAG